MNATANRLTHAVMIAAALAACFMVQQARAADAATAKVVMLPKVMVTGKRVQPAQVVYLQRVEVTGKRAADSRDTLQAGKDGKDVLVAMR